MANIITEECFSCGACEPVCPANGISRAEETFVIDRARCTECVGFYHTQQCARACPIDCCVIDPNNVETEAVLFERAKKLRPGTPGAPQLGPETSHFQAHNRSLGSTLKQMGRRLSDVVRGPGPLALSEPQEPS